MHEHTVEPTVAGAVLATALPFKLEEKLQKKKKTLLIVLNVGFDYFYPALLLNR